MTGNNLLTGPMRPVFLFLALLFTSVIPGLGRAQATSLPVTRLTIGHHRVQAEVAATQAQLEHGLMGRTSLPDNHGMLFVFNRAAPWCFWMKDTPLPLSIAFIGAGGAIVSIDDMQPFTETVHCPPSSVLYALEMKQGWFLQAGIAAGQRVKGLPASKPPQR